MQKPVVIVAPALRAYGYRRLAAGILIGAALAYGLMQPATAVVDTRMEKACGNWPRYEGEHLAVAVVNGKVICWQMGYNR